MGKVVFSKDSNTSFKEAWQSITKFGIAPYKYDSAAIRLKVATTAPLDLYKFAHLGEVLIKVNKGSISLTSATILIDEIDRLPP